MIWLFNEGYILLITLCDCFEFLLLLLRKWKICFSSKEHTVEFLKKRHINITGHDLLDIKRIHLFTPNFNTPSMLLATRTYFPLS